jgi:hypothetical protein
MIQPLLKEFGQHFHVPDSTVDKMAAVAVRLIMARRLAPAASDSDLGAEGSLAGRV